MGKKLFTKMRYPATFNMQNYMDKESNSPNHTKGGKLPYKTDCHIQAMSCTTYMEWLFIKASPQVVATITHTAKVSLANGMNVMTKWYIQ